MQLRMGQTAESALILISATTAGIREVMLAVLVWQ